LPIKEYVSNLIGSSVTLIVDSHTTGLANRTSTVIGKNNGSS